MMPKKRDSPDDSDSDDDSSVEEETRMMVDEEEDQEEDEEMSDTDVPFLDTFYGLSSSSGSERAQAAHGLLKHCLFGPNANIKDAAYALKRLLNGLCSGRASARQGYASALTSFLKISFQQGSIDDIKREDSGDDEEQTALVFIRNRLLSTTDPNKTETGKFGKKKGSEERDYCFGRIFGILSVIRSGILLMEVSGLEQVAIGFANDLLELYQRKKWMREPATQGILTLLSCFYGSDDETTRSVAKEIVEQAIIPKLLLLESKDQERQALLGQYSPEQIAIAVHIQSSSKGVALSFPLDEPILSSENMTHLSESLASTSHVVHPRTHLVWDVLWSSLTVPTKGTHRKTSQRVLCQHAPASSESSRDVVSELFRTVVIKSLLGICGQEQSTSSGKSSSTTHERRALALSLVKVLCGGEYMSSTMGPVTVLLDPDLLENVIMCPVVIQRLLLDVISAGRKSGSQQQQHMLKPLALHVLESIVPKTEDELSWKRRLSFAKAIVRCDPRFDSRTKTRTLSNLLLLDETAVVVGDVETDVPLYTMWTDYVEFLEQCMLSSESSSEGVDEARKEMGSRSTSYEALGYVDLLYNAVKHILRMQSEEESSSLEEFKGEMTKNVLGFLMASAFFDCSELSAVTATEHITSSKKKKKKKKKSKENKSESEDGNVHPAVSGGFRVQKIKSPNLVPYAVRTTLSSRFYSLLADYIAATVPRRTSKSEKSTPGLEGSSEAKHKDRRILEILVDVCHGWACLEDRGAIRFNSTTEGEDEEDMEKAAGDTKKCVGEFQTWAISWNESVQDKEEMTTMSKGKCVFGSAQLMSILYLHLLHCGKPENLADENDDPDSDDDDNDSEIMELISDLSDVTKTLLGEKRDDEDEDENPLLELAALCINILSSPLCSGSQTRGASSKIVRETLKSAWTGGLRAATFMDSHATDATALIDEDVVNILLDAVGASDGNSEAENELDESDVEMDVDDDSEDEEMNEGGREEVIFSATAAEVLNSDNDEDNVNMAAFEADNKRDVEDNEEVDVELDPTQLQSLLLEDSDADQSAGSDGELEHHAGADAALVQLIKLKQDARKAGKQARERLEISNQLRCAVLLEGLVSTLSSSGGSASSSLVRSEVVLQTLVPLLQARRSLEKSLASSSTLGKKGSGASNEKRALLDRLTSLLKTKICKMRLANIAILNSEGVAPYASNLSSHILSEARKSNELGHSSCCSAALIMTLRSIPEPEHMVAAAAVYKDAVNEWSTKRTTRLSTILFEDLIQQHPSLAQAVLTSPLTTATVEARSPFLKSEAFSLLASVYSSAKTPATESSSLEITGTETLREVAPIVAKNSSEALQNSDMQKPKRMRDVLKAMEKIVSFAATTSMSGEGKELRLCLRDLLEHLGTLRETTESHGVKNACQKLSNDITSAMENMGTDEDVETDNKAAGDKTTPKVPERSLSTGKKKKKKKKKK